jgi:hypothetical protein
MDLTVLHARHPVGSVVPELERDAARLLGRGRGNDLRQVAGRVVLEGPDAVRRVVQLLHEAVGVLGEDVLEVAVVLQFGDLFAGVVRQRGRVAARVGDHRREAGAAEVDLAAVLVGEAVVAAGAGGEREHVGVGAGLGRVGRAVPQVVARQAVGAVDDGAVAVGSPGVARVEDLALHGGLEGEDPAAAELAVTRDVRAPQDVDGEVADLGGVVQEVEGVAVGPADAAHAVLVPEGRAAAGVACAGAHALQVGRDIAPERRRERKRLGRAGLGHEQHHQDDQRPQDEHPPTEALDLTSHGGSTLRGASALRPARRRSTPVVDRAPFRGGTRAVDRLRHRDLRRCLAHAGPAS